MSRHAKRIQQPYPRVPLSLCARLKINLSLFLLLFTLLSTSLALAAPLKVHFIDIGQGDSALIESPGGKIILVDSGPSQSWSALRDYLDALKLKQIDLMINSHPHADHIGNAAKVIDRYHVKAVLDPGFSHPIKAYRDLLEAVKEKEIPLRLGRLGRKIQIGGGAELELFAPEEPFIRNSRSDPNSNSIVFRLTYKDQAALFTGDAEEETESRLMPHAKRLRADLLKVAHHGSKHASSRAFLDAVKPKHAVVSCSETNRYGHPAPETIEALKRVEAKPWVTALKGTIVASTEGQSWHLVQANQALPSTPEEGSQTVQKVPKSTTDPVENTIIIAQSSSASPSTKLGTPDCTHGQININKATLTELKTLPRIGAALGQRIIDSRAEGLFTSASELRRVKGIGAKTVENLAQLICF